MILLIRNFHFMITFEPTENFNAGALYQILSYINEITGFIYMVVKFLSDILSC